MRPRFEFVCFRDVQEEQTEDWWILPGDRESLGA